MKKIIGIVVLLTVIMTSFNIVGYAYGGSESEYKTEFKDLKQNHWAHEAVMKMVEHGIINGYKDGSFKPQMQVTRGEFAKMMVLALDLPLVKSYNSSFEDVSKSDWEIKYVETAKYYLTGFRNNNGDYFKSKSFAVREDMAVALVKALQLEVNESNIEFLNKYEDKHKVSLNLSKYVGIAIKNGIMVGSGNKFEPQESLTRAEAATLLSRLINEEKVTYDEEKITYDAKDEVDEVIDTPTTFKVEGEVKDNSVKLYWEKANEKGFKYYKVVISKYKERPKYPEDGYMVCLTNINETSYAISPYSKYNRGDFGGKVLPGEKYYFSITAVYENEKVAGNAIKMEIPD